MFGDVTSCEMNCWRCRGSEECLYDNITQRRLCKFCRKEAAQTEAAQYQKQPEEKYVE